jgi:hypothetical protein
VTTDAPARVVDLTTAVGMMLAPAAVLDDLAQAGRRQSVSRDLCVATSCDNLSCRGD